MENYLYLTSNTPSVFVVNNIIVGNNMHNDDYIIIKTDEEFLYIQCIPINNKNKLPSCVMLNFFNINFAKNLNAKIIKLSNQNYKIFFNLPDCIVYHPSTLLCSTIINNLSLSFWDSTTQFLIIQNENTMQKITINYYIKEPKFINYLQYYALTGKTDNLDYVLIFDSYGNILFEEAQNIIELNKENITTLQKIKDIANHGYVSKYKINDGIVHTLEQYSVYLDERPHIAPNNMIVALAFLEAINIKNLSLARSYLCDELSSTLTDNQLTDFFGGYTEFEPNFLNNADNSLLLTYSNNLVKKYKIIVNKNGKIEDILLD